MLRASRVFSSEEKQKINAAVAQAEKHTSGEIVPVVATASGDYDRAEDLVGLWVAAIGLMLLWWSLLPSSPSGDWIQPSAQVSWKELLLALAVLVLGFLLGATLASYLGWLRRLFTTRSQMRLYVESSAGKIFFEQNLRATRARTGILIYVSLFERMVSVTGDQTISEKLTQNDWQQVCDLILDGIKKGNLTEGLIVGIRRCGEILAQTFPSQAEDQNELPNDLRIID